MFNDQLTRRQALKLGAAALPLLGGAPVAAAAVADPAPGDGPIIGIATFGFGGYTNQRLAEELASSGLRVVQLFLSQSDSPYWKYNGPSDVSAMTPARCEAIAGIWRAAGITIHSFGIYGNLIHPDPAEREANVANFEAMMEVAHRLGAGAVVTESGHYCPPEAAAAVGYHFRPDVWKRMVETFKDLAARAERHGVTILVEPSYLSVLATAKRTRAFIEEVGSPRLRVLLDPANLLEVNDLEEMFAQLGKWIDCFHAKDWKLHSDHGVAAGKGDLDYARFVKLAAAHAPRAPLILEYVGPADYKQALAHLRGVLAKQT